MDAPGNLQSAAPPTLAARLLAAAGQIELASKLAIVCVFFGWFLVDTLVVTLGSLQHGVRFFDISAVIADPSRMFFGLQGSVHRVLFIPLCIVCMFAPALPHFSRIRVLWLSYIAPLTLMVTCGALLFARTSGQFIAAPSNASQTAGNLIRFANDLVHHGGDLVARHVSVGIGGYLALAASVVLAAQGRAAVSLGTVSLSGGAHGLGDRKLQGPEERRSLKLPIPQAVHRGTLKLTVPEDEFLRVATVGRVAACPLVGQKIRCRPTRAVSAGM